MYNRPTNHVDFLSNCLDKIKQDNQKDLQWSTFLKPLPDIKRNSADSDAFTNANEADRMFETETPYLDLKGKDPLPPISKTFPNTKDTTYVFVQGIYCYSISLF